jgi:lipoprotein NlpD
MWRYLCMTGLLLAGCASHAPAPVVDRKAPTVVEAGPSGATPPAASSAPREGFYVVKKGDTLRHIAQEHGVDFRDLAAWNYMENPAKIEIGQQLRVVPPDGVVVKPVVGPGQVVLVGEPTQAARDNNNAGNNTDTLKREPRGGTIAYSEKALAQARAMEGGVQAGKVDEPKPADKPAETPADKPAPAPTVPPAPTEGGIDWGWPAAGKVLANFVEGGGGQASNKGVDIGGRLGEPVLAAAAGKVTYVGNLRGYGDFVVVRHNADFISVYAHAGKILVKKEQSVAKGQKIAEVGNSDAEQPKLHFEIRRQSKPVDPLKILPARP